MYHSECIHFYNGLRLEYSLHLHYQCHADRKCNCNNFYSPHSKNYYNRNAGSVSLLKVATYSVSTRGNNGSNSRTINLSGCRDYQNFAIDKNIFISGSCTRIIWCQPKGSYNASTGILTLSVSILGEQDANSVGTATATVVYF